MFGTRGLTIPFLFSNLALDANTSGVRRLIQTFLRTCVSFHALDTERTWHEEARFAIPAVSRRTYHVPSMGSCPSLACVWGEASSLGICTSSGVRLNLVSDSLRHVFTYTMLTPVHSPRLPSKPALIAHLQQPIPSIIINVLSLLARLTAHSSSSGHTPPTISPLFGPLLFGLGPPALIFHHTYLEYLCATNAMEHVLLSFLHSQDAPSNESPGSHGGGPGNAASLGVPTSGLPNHAPGTGRSINQAQEAPISPWDPYRTRCRRMAEHSHVCARSRQEPNYSTSQRGGLHPKYIRIISRLGASGSTDAQAEAAIRRQFQEAHRPFP